MKTLLPESLSPVRRASLLFFASSLGVGFAETFTLDPTRSVVTLSGSAVGVPFEAQGAGSLETTYSGTINATLGATTITFPGGSAMLAANSGNWEPMTGGAPGTAPANYGAKASNPLATANAASRKLQIDVLSGAIAITDGSFASTDTDLSVPVTAGGVVDYRVTGFLNDAKSLAFSGTADNAAATKGTLVTDGDVQTLTLPVDITYLFKLISDDDTVIQLTGKFVATRTVGGGGNTFDSWTATSFPGVNDPAVIGPSADPDGDSIPNFVEFAFGLNPGSPNPDFAPLSARIDPANPDVLTLEYVRPKGLEGVAYSLRASEDLVNWTPLDVVPQITDLGDGRERVTFHDTVSIDGATQPRYVQLQVTMH